MKRNNDIVVLHVYCAVFQLCRYQSQKGKVSYNTVGMVSGMGWDGMGWDGRGWDGMGWVRSRWCKVESFQVFTAVTFQVDVFCLVTS
jgi:hypothetical protein